MTVEPIEIDRNALEQVLSRGGSWAVYQNLAHDSTTRGQIIFLRYGEGCTHTKPPPHAPDGAHGTGWKYLLVGLLSEDGTHILQGCMGEEGFVPSMPPVPVRPIEPPPHQAPKRKR